MNYWIKIDLSNIRYLSSIQYSDPIYNCVGKFYTKHGLLDGLNTGVVFAETNHTPFGVDVKTV